MHLSDKEIRFSLRESIAEEKFFLNDPRCLLVDELGLCQGSARIDLAVLNGQIHGYEIKSDRDTLERLDSQLEIYEKIFDRLTIVVGKKHLGNIDSKIPDWSGITLAYVRGGETCLEVIRRGKLNKKIDPHSVVQLLWKDETISILRKLGDTASLENKPRQVAWERLVTITSSTQLNRYVREALKDRVSRVSWRQSVIV